MRVNTRYINSARGTTAKGLPPPPPPSGRYIPYISGTLGDTGVHRHKTVFMRQALAGNEIGNKANELRERLDSYEDKLITKRLN